MSQFNMFSGTPRIIQFQSTPGISEALSENDITAFNSGILVFGFCRNPASIYILTALDSQTSVQEWILFSDQIEDVAYIGLLPIMDKLKWATSIEDSPTSQEPIPESLLSDWTIGLLWWNKGGKLVFKLTAYDPESANPQTWTEIL